MGIAGAKILVVDEDLNAADMLRLYLAREGFHCQVTNDSQEALQLWEAVSPELVILDLDLPGLGGWELSQQIRSQTAVPLLVLTSLEEAGNQLLRLDLNPADYVLKPFDPNEVVARVKAVLRQASAKDGVEQPTLEHGQLRIDPSHHQVFLDQQLIELTPREVDLLYLLASNPGEVFSRETLVDHIWGFDNYSETRSVDAHVQRLRRQLGLPSGGHSPRDWDIITVWSVGYKFELAGSNP